VSQVSGGWPGSFATATSFRKLVARLHDDGKHAMGSTATRYCKRLSIPIDEVRAELCAPAAGRRVAEDEGRRSASRRGKPWSHVGRAGAAACHPGNQQRRHRSQSDGRGNSQAQTTSWQRRSAELEASNKELKLLLFRSHDRVRHFAHMVGFTELLQKHASIGSGWKEPAIHDDDPGFGEADGQPE